MHALEERCGKLIYIVCRGGDGGGGFLSRGAVCWTNATIAHVPSLCPVKNQESGMRVGYIAGHLPSRTLSSISSGSALALRWQSESCQ